MNTVAIIGAGASGMLCAYYAAQNGAKVILLDKNSRPGRKLMITGKGRCNLTNNCDDVRRFTENVPRNGRFLYSALNFLSPQQLMMLFESNGLKLKTERGNRVFPVSDKAVDVVDTLSKMLSLQHVSLSKMNVTAVSVSNGAVNGVFADGREIPADSVVIATGGASYMRTGSTGDGFKFAATLGHHIIHPTASLVPLETTDKSCSQLMGLSLKNVSISLYSNNDEKPVYTDFGEMLFTHFGLSGPIILSASAFMSDEANYTVSIDLKPALTCDELSKRLLRDFSQNINKDLINSLDNLLPQKLIATIVERSKIDPRKKCNVITKEEREEIVNIIKYFKFTIKKKRPIEEAIITSGGVDTNEINPKTMESKLIKGLYFAGEVIDVDALTGGFNLQIAFSTGALAGMNAAQPK